MGFVYLCTYMGNCHSCESSPPSHFRLFVFLHRHPPPHVFVRSFSLPVVLPQTDSDASDAFTKGIPRDRTAKRERSSELHLTHPAAPLLLPPLLLLPLPPSPSLPMPSPSPPLPLTPSLWLSESRRGGGATADREPARLRRDRYRGVRNDGVEQDCGDSA